jgi:glutaryl-CoA dehydrogenase
MNAPEQKAKAQFVWDDPLLLEQQLTQEERMVRDAARAYCQEKLAPRVLEAFRHEKKDETIFREMGALGMLGPTLPAEYGGPGLNYVSYGLIAREVERVDSGYRSTMSVQSSLVMLPIFEFGTEAQRKKYLPKLAAGEWIGCFGLTEPNHGSDAVALETSARRDGAEFVLDGAKKWIGNASFADVTIIWARGEDGHVGGYLVEKGTEGFHTEVITGKTSLRAVWQAEITLDGVRVPAANRLPGCRSFRDVARVLTLTRYTVAWRALGVALAAYEAALSYAKERHQFGRPLASFQLVQDKLSRMVGEITAMQLLCLRLSELAGDERLTAGMASLAKMNHAAKARAIVADARDILGGNGILLEHHVARHHADMEAVFTFEGTDSIQSLIVGREITGLQAIAPSRE